MNPHAGKASAGDGGDLYMPGSSARALEKAKTLPADGVTFDLEDAIAPDAKESR